MEVEVLRKKIITALNNGEVTKAIDLLVEFLSINKFHEERDQMIVVKSKWANTEKDFRVIGSMSRSEYEILSGKTIQAVLSILQSSVGVDLEIQTFQTEPIFRNRMKISLFIAIVIITALGIIGSSYFRNQKKQQLEQTEEANSYFEKPGVQENSGVQIVEKEKNNRKDQRKTEASPAQSKNGIGLKVNNTTLLQELVGILGKTGKKIILVGDTQSQQFDKYIVGDFSIKPREQKKEIFGTVVFIYDVSFALELRHQASDKICNARFFKATVEANEFDSQEKIAEQGMQMILNQMDLSSDFYTCD